MPKRDFGKEELEREAEESAMDWNVCVPPKCTYWNLIPEVMVLGGGTLMNEISAFIKKELQGTPLVVKWLRIWLSPRANTGDTGSISGPGRSHLPQGN